MNERLIDPFISSSSTSSPPLTKNWSGDATLCTTQILFCRRNQFRSWILLVRHKYVRASSAVLFISQTLGAPVQYEGVQCGRWPHLPQLSQVGLTIVVPFHLPLVLLISDNRVYIPMTIPSLRIFGGSFIAFTHRHRSPSTSMEYNRVPASIFSILAEHDWRFSVVEGDNSIIPQNTPKSKPLIGATTGCPEVP